MHAGGRWRAAGDIADITIPDTVQSVLAARIDLLAPEEKRTLQSAAVVGRVFWPGPVSQLLNGEASLLDDILGRLEDRELVLARLGSTLQGEREYAFKHILTRDVAYETLPRRERSSAHAEVARWLEGTAGERAGEFAELLAYHYEEAFRGAADGEGGDAETFRQRAFSYLTQSSRDARSRLAVEKAERLADRALSLAAGPVERATALEALGDAYVSNYRGNLSWETLREAAETLLREAPEERHAIARVIGKAVETPMRWPGSMTALPDHDVLARYIDLGLAHAPDTDSFELARLLTAKAFMPFAYPEETPGDEQFEEAHRAGLAAAEMGERLGRPDVVSAALDGAGAGFLTRGMYGRLQELIDRRLELATTVLEDPWELGDIYGVAAWQAFALGRFREAQARADEGLRRTTFDAPGVALHCLSWRAVARYRLGDWDGILEDVERARALLGERIATLPGFSFIMFGAAAVVHEARGNPSATDRILAAMRGGVEERQDRPTPGLKIFEAEVLTRRGEFDAALESLSHPYLSQALGFHFEALQARGRLVAEAGWWDRAPDVIRESRRFSTVGGYLALPLFADRLEGQAALAGGDPSTAVELLRRASDGLRDLEAVWEAARVDLSLAEALLATGDRDDVERRVRNAAQLFERLGSVRELERARELLGKLG